MKYVFPASKYTLTDLNTSGALPKNDDSNVNAYLANISVVHEKIALR